MKQIKIKYESKGYTIDSGYMGWDPEAQKYVLFESDTEYYDAYNELYGEKDGTEAIITIKTE